MGKIKHDSINTYCAEEEIRQLHSIILSISNRCFELKKICITIIVAIIAAIPYLKNAMPENYIPILFLTLLYTICSFYFYDSYCYFYQRKLRTKMNSIFNMLIENNSPWMTKLDEKKANFTGALFNISHIFYVILVIVLLIFYICIKYYEK